MISPALATAVSQPALALLSAQLLAFPPASKPSGRNDRLEPVQRWRQAHPELFEQRRVEGMKKSPLVRANLLRLHRERKAEWHASARRNPKLRATSQHIAAKEWALRSPLGSIHRFRNLKQFIREHSDLFEAEDVVWKEVPERPSQAWCRAFHGLGRLRPGNAKQLPEWNGWTWEEESRAS